MKGTMQSGWYRKPDDAPHILRRVSGSGQFFITCQFDTRSGMPCDPGGPLDRADWGRLIPVPDPGFLPA